MCALGGSKAHDGGIYAVSMGVVRGVRTSVHGLKGTLAVRGVEQVPWCTGQGHAGRVTWPGEARGRIRRPEY